MSKHHADSLRMGNHHERLNSIQHTTQRSPQIFRIQRGEAFIEKNQVRAL
jgi:hypothetical protein